jgi:hypothetical protein
MIKKFFGIGIEPITWGVQLLSSLETTIPRCRDRG